MNVIFCDINGTIDGSAENRDYQLRKLADLLIKLKIDLDNDDFVFRFITTEKTETLIQYVNELQFYLKDSGVRMTSQFSEHQRYKNGKIEDISLNTKVDQIVYISKIHPNFKKVFIADDCLANQRLICHNLLKLFPGVELTSLIPGNNLNDGQNSFSSSKRGIEGLNEALEKCVNKLELDFNNTKTSRSI